MAYYTRNDIISPGCRLVDRSGVKLDTTGSQAVSKCLLRDGSYCYYRDDALEAHIVLFH